MRRLTLTLTITLSLIIASLPNSVAAEKAGTGCKTLGVTSTVKNYKYTCTKLSGKLIWSKGQKVLKAKPSPSKSPQIPKITFENLEENSENISLAAWAKSNVLWTKYDRKIQGAQLLFGPSKKPLNCYGGVHEFTKISNFWRQFKQPEKITAIYSAPEDAKWSANEFMLATGDTGPTLTGAGVAKVNSKGIGQMVFYVSGSEEPKNCGGGIEKHEYTHLVQFSQRSKTGELLKISPPKWFVEGQAEFAVASEFPLEFYKKFSSANRLIPQNLFTDFEPVTLITYLQNFGILSAADYVIGFQVLEILAAIAGPQSTMEIFVEMAEGKSFNEAFENIYKITWAKAVPTIANVLSVQIKSNQNAASLSQFVKTKGEIGMFKWPDRGFFDETLFK